MLLFSRATKNSGTSGIVTSWAGQVRLRYRWPMIRDALKYLWMAIQGFYIAELASRTSQFINNVCPSCGVGSDELHDLGCPAVTIQEQCEELQERLGQTL